MTNTRRNHKFIRTRRGTYCAVQNHVIKIFQSGCKNLHSTNPSLQFAKPDRFVWFLTNDRRGPMLGPPEIQGPRSARTSGTIFREFDRKLSYFCIRFQDLGHGSEPCKWLGSVADSWSEQREELDRREWKDCDQVQYVARGDCAHAVLTGLLAACRLLATKALG